VLELARYHSPGKLSAPESTHDFLLTTERIYAYSTETQLGAWLDKASHPRMRTWLLWNLTVNIEPSTRASRMATDLEIVFRVTPQSSPLYDAFKFAATARH
jgi:hypothetical protein